YGAAGVVIKFHRILLSLNTTITGCALSRLHSLRSSPSARAKDASRPYLDRAATPPRRGGKNWPLLPFGQQPLAAGVTFFRPPGLFRYWKKDAEFGTCADRAVHFEHAVVRFDNQFAVEETDAQALLLGCLKRFK